MTVTAPPSDPAGAALDAAIATSQALVNNTPTSSPVYPAYAAQLNQLQVEAVDHYMSTGWLTPGNIFLNGLGSFGFHATAISFSSNWPTITGPVSTTSGTTGGFAFGVAPGYVAAYLSIDPTGAAFATRISSLAVLIGNNQASPAFSAYCQQLYALQCQLVDYLMSMPGGLPAATILAGCTGVQAFPFEYSFNSVGFTDEWIDD